MTEESLDLQVTGVFGNNDRTMSVSNNVKVRFAEEETTLHNLEVAAGAGDTARIEKDAIDTISKSRSRFPKRDQIRVDKACMLKHVSDFLSDDILIYSVMTNRIRNNTMNKRNIKICNEMIRKSKCLDQLNSAMKSSDSIDVNNQFVELPPTMLDCYRSAQLVADVMHSRDVPFTHSMSKHMHYGTSNSVTA